MSYQPKNSPRRLTEAERLLWESHKYIPTQYSFIPMERGVCVAVSYGTHRTANIIAETSEELWEFLKTSYDESLRQHKLNKKHEELNRQHTQAAESLREAGASLSLNVDLDIPVNDLGIDLKL